MKPIKLLLSILLLSFLQVKAQTQSSLMDTTLQSKVMKFIEFVDAYDDGSPESLKKAKYNEMLNLFVDDAGTAKERANAYKIIHAYIKADKVPEKGEVASPKANRQQTFEEQVKNTDEGKQGEELMQRQYAAFMNISYPEFEKMILSINPATGKKEKKQAYNEMHKANGKQVTITPVDNEMTELQKQMWAIEILKKPNNYAEFCKAARILQPEITSEELNTLWSKRDK
ncbi:hypothetical protein [Marinifilum flexuosum]|uniref:Uncharacterized protein n=1 Tax=Marinifilum flexuosum TaxID=1117708 RepID=A0A419X7J8_9BACT|nr:hypothetical protein [Marinifilum flexuosum]RKE03636.1 hypothetical protein BXY64_0645 [Marinifilum flexuosum]